MYHVKGFNLLLHYQTLWSGHADNFPAFSDPHAVYIDAEVFAYKAMRALLLALALVIGCLAEEAEVAPNQLHTNETENAGWFAFFWLSSLSIMFFFQLYVWWGVVCEHCELVLAVHWVVAVLLPVHCSARERWQRPCLQQEH